MTPCAECPSSVYPIASSGRARWTQFAEETFNYSRNYGGLAATVCAIPASEYSTAAAQSLNNILSSLRFEGALGRSMINWHGLLGKVVEVLIVPTTASGSDSNG